MARDEKEKQLRREIEDLKRQLERKREDLNEHLEAKAGEHDDDDDGSDEL